MVLQPAGTPHPDGSGRHLCLDQSRMNNDYCSMLSFSPWVGGVQCWMNHTVKSQHITYRNPGEHCHVLHPMAYRYLNDLEKEAVECQPQYEVHCNGLLMALMAVLVREIQQMHAFSSYETGLAPHRLIQDNNLISHAQTYIDDHLHEPLSIDQVAAYVYMSRAYFTRQFRLATGKTFMEYVTECRLEKAKVLLRNTTWSLEMVGASVGISPEQLRRIFLRHEQQTPAGFRRQNGFLK
jgi:AraC-like DNA-binding protein